MGADGRAGEVEDADEGSRWGIRGRPGGDVLHGSGPALRGGGCLTNLSCQLYLLLGVDRLGEEGVEGEECASISGGCGSRIGEGSRTLLDLGVLFS